MVQRIIRWIPAIIIMGIIYIASSTPGFDLPDFGIMDLLAKKGGHLLGYALLGAAYAYACKRDGLIVRSKVILSGILIVLYACIDEWHQSFIPGRNPSFLDIGIDIIGGFLGIVLLTWLSRFLRKTGGQAHSNRC